MKQDIRSLFNHDRFPKKKLPDSHREEFLQKLQELPTDNRNKVISHTLFKIAASISVLVAITFFAKKQYNNPIENHNNKTVMPVKDQPLHNYEEKQNTIASQPSDKSQAPLNKTIETKPMHFKTIKAVPKSFLSSNTPVEIPAKNPQPQPIKTDSFQVTLVQNPEKHPIKINSSALLFSVTHSSNEVLAYYKEHNLLRASVLASIENDLRNHNLLNVDAEALLIEIEQSLDKTSFKDKLLKTIKLKIKNLSNAIVNN